MNSVIEDNNGRLKMVRVYDFGDKEIDRYTIVNVSGKGKDSKGVVYYLVYACSEHPFHPQGVGMYVGDYYPCKYKSYNFGRRIKDISSLPKDVIKYIKQIVS